MFVVTFGKISAVWSVVELIGVVDRLRSVHCDIAPDITAPLHNAKHMIIQDLVSRNYCVKVKVKVIV